VHAARVFGTSRNGEAPKSSIGNRFLVMHRQQSRLATLAGLISIGLWSSGFAVAHGASGGNSNASHGAGFHSSRTSRGYGHHRGGWHRERGSSDRNRGGGQGGWNIPGHGFYFASIPSYCKIVYWDGVPYYYADDVYYEWSGTAGAYEQVQPPAGLAESINSQAPALRDLFVFPNADQTIEQLERDREECQQWAADQVGLDPKVSAKRANYLRADGACLEARDYSVE
jgi:hypothetical protein